MKIINKIKTLSVVTYTLTLLFTSCQLDDGESLNGASTNSISSDLSRGELPQALSGVLSSMRNGLATNIDVQSILGREYYYFTNSDPRFEGDVVKGNLDNNTFYITRPWSSRYSSLKNINLILDGLEKTTSDLSSNEINATKGVLKTLKAYELLMLANNQYKNGIRLEINDPNNLGKIENYDTAITEILNLIDSAINDLKDGGDKLPFNLTSGYANFDTPPSFLKLTNALGARVSTYKKDPTKTLSYLNSSFLDLDGSMNTGVFHTFSTSGADTSNPLFIALNQESNVRVAHESFITDAENGDNRLGKVVLRNTPREASGLVGKHDVFIYKSNTDMVPIIRNEELILLYAEANLTNSSEAIKAINIIRKNSGLNNYNGAEDKETLINEILRQRRYSLFGEGHRWIDMRRLGKLDQLPNDRADDSIPESLPIPATEN